MAKSKPKAKGPSQRMLRVGELIRHEMASIFMRGDLHEIPMNTALITVPEVRVSPDLKIATVYIMPLGGKGQKQAIDVLSTHAKAIRTAIAPKMTLKYMPTLRFRIDESFAEGHRIDALLNSEEVKRDLRDKEDEESAGA
jgi:ribosome-binding factor A